MRATLALAALLSVVVAQIEVPPPDFLDLFVTYRDFLPASCLTQANRAAVVVDAWGSSSLSFPNACGLLLSAANAPLWRTALLNGEIAGHPDFEAAGLFTNQNDCGLGVFRFPVGDCTADFGARNTVVGRNLVIGANGLPKPPYCADEGGDTVCGLTNPSGKTQSKKKFFDTWFNDDETFNKRVGMRLRLTLQDAVNGLYAFNSGNTAVANDDEPAAADFPGDHDVDFFGPLNMFKTGGSRQVNLNIDPKDAPAWPVSANDRNDGKKAFWLTTELHTTFEFKVGSQMTFTFSGDDDFWCYINNKLAVDVGGMHSRRERTINLFDPRGNIPALLGLVDGEVYNLDIFHAERQRTASNFQIETTLFPACNVLISGAPTINFKAGIPNNQIQNLFVTRGVTVNNNIITLINNNEIGTARHIFSKAQENVLRGFKTRFFARISPGAQSQGFAFVLQAQGVDDYPLSSGDNLNFAGLTKSIAIVLDLCADKTAACATQEIRVHHPNNPNSPNNPTTATRKVHDRILRKVQRRALDGSDEAFPIEIIYFGGKPDTLEVYVNNSLYLRETGFEISEIIGSAGAHVGFTTSSGSFSSRIRIEEWVFETVVVNPEFSSFVLNEIDEPQFTIADGSNTTEGFPLGTFDSCANALESGTLADQAKGFYVEVPNEDGFYFNGTTEGKVATAEIVDNNDGTYNLALVTDKPGDYKLVGVFGAGCNANVAFQNRNNGGVNVRDPVLTPTGSNCFFGTFLDGETVARAFAPNDPNIPTVDPDLVEGEPTNVLLIAGIAGGAGFCGLVALVGLVQKKKKWDREKHLIESGNLYRLDANTAYTNNGEYQETGKALLDSQNEIHRLRNKATTEDRSEEIAKLKAANESLKGVIKEAKVQEATVPVPVAKPTKGKAGKKRERKEF